MAAEGTPANAADNLIAPQVLRELPLALRYGWGDQHYTTPALCAECGLQNRIRVATRGEKYPPTEGGVDVRRLFHKLGSQALAPFKGLFKNRVKWRGPMLVKGLSRRQLFALGAVFVYQLLLLYQHQQHLPMGVGSKPLLRAA